MRVLELFSGTHSIGKVAEKMGWEVISLDRDLGPTNDGYTSSKHIKKDILEWDYKNEYKEGDFDLITASPVCLWWSKLRHSWINRKSKTINPDGSIVKKEDLERDIDLYGKPMVNKCFEIIDYFKPKHWWIENPATGKMKNYIESDYPHYNTYYDVDYCKYSDFGYKKTTRFWTNLKGFEAKRCKNDCENMLEVEGKKQHNIVLANGYEMIDGKKVLCNTKEKRNKLRQHKKSFGSKNPNQKCVGGGSSRLERYRIPEKLITEFFNLIQNGSGIEDIVIE